MNPTNTNSDIPFAYEIGTRITGALRRVIRGRDDTIKLVLTALFADGHVLLEDYPGSGKTTLSKTLGNLISSGSGVEHILAFRRIQFTPDMLPGDVLGVNVFDPKSGQFHFLHGPVFAHVVLADEINRTGPKVQAAFLECMAEKQVTIDNVTYPLDDLFFVIGTQNPIDIAGTYPLPLVQLDRFLLKVPMSYVDRKTEYEILEQHEAITIATHDVTPVCSRDEVLRARKASASVFVSQEMRQAIVDIVQATRDNPIVHYGASTRAALMLQRCVRSWAMLSGRDYANEDDLKTLLPFVLLHRIKFHGGGDASSLLEEICTPHLETLIRKRPSGV